jgi:hypothetical protein
MGAIFSHHRHHQNKNKKPKVQITDHDRAVLDLKAAKDRLKRYQVKVSQSVSQISRWLAREGLGFGVWGWVGTHGWRDDDGGGGCVD